MPLPWIVAGAKLYIDFNKAKGLASAQRDLVDATKYSLDLQNQYFEQTLKWQAEEAAKADAARKAQEERQAISDERTARLDALPTVYDLQEHTYAEKEQQFENNVYAEAAKDWVSYARKHEDPIRSAARRRYREIAIDPIERREYA